MYVHPIELYTDISSKNMILKTLIHNTAVHVIYSKVSGQFSQTIHCNKQALSLELFLLNPVLWHYNKQAFCMWGGGFPILIFILWLFFQEMLKYTKDDKTCQQQLEDALNTMLEVVRIVNNSMYEISIVGFPVSLFGFDNI